MQLLYTILGGLDPYNTTDSQPHLLPRFTRFSAFLSLEIQSLNGIKNAYKPVLDKCGYIYKIYMHKISQPNRLLNFAVNFRLCERIIASIH